MQTRKLEQIVKAQPASDGDGVRINRIAGSHLNARLDPFLLIDEIRSDDSADYIGGFPPHPHRGFETVTYMLTGRLRHQDHMGNEGVIESGDLQWMTAGRGVVHSEMPEQTEGLMHGFQLWLNLPAEEKMKPAAYRDIRSAEIPETATPDGSKVRWIAGQASLNGTAYEGVVQGLTTQPLYLDIEMAPGDQLRLDLASELNLLVFVFQGATTELGDHELGIYGAGDSLELASKAEGTHLLVLGGKPLREPVVQHGPFVMNTQEEIFQAVRDYQSGQLTA